MHAAALPDTPVNLKKVQKLLERIEGEIKGFIVFQDKAGFLYLRKLVEREGLATPFSSIQEIEMALDMRLELVREETYPGNEGDREAKP